jgi:catechol 2,3-dioxygenase-like lactoylglutathione lyase family enzyme
MRALSLLSLTLPTDDPDRACAWWAEQLGLPVDEDEPGALALGDVAVRFGPSFEAKVVSFDLESPEALVDPDGRGVVVVPPDAEAAARNEDSIRSFVDNAASLPGRAVDEVADDVAAEVLATQQRLHELVAALPHDKRLAVYLELGQRAREAGYGGQWHLHAASTLLSGTFGPES